MQIAPFQKQQIDFLRGMLKSLQGTVDRSQREDFRALGERLDNWAAKIAVVGQVKAGKSTFMNAFIQQHDFLPSDVTPWTSVVTNIRVNIPGDLPTGATFEFFSEKDWEEMVDGTGEIRKLTEELLPGFDADILKNQSEEMRRRAERRLGKNYRPLLGSKHEYEFLSPDLLKRYVCAGPGSDDGLGRDALGRYAAITKEANVYMRLPEFQVPAIITDTPGVNDPFLVRDEVTCRSLDKSDIYVVVLSAHQALTEVDIALIRILALQDEKDVIVFVNRIDELDEYATEVDQVIADVSERLSAAIPDIDFTIIAGSAHMSDIALRNDDEAAAERAALDDEQLVAYLEKTYGEVPEHQMDRFLLASGMGEVKRTLSTVIDNGIGCKQLNQIAEDVRAELAGAQYATKRERNSVQAQIEEIGAANSEGAIETLEAEIESIKKVQAAVDEAFEKSGDEIDAIVAEGWSTLEQKLNSEVEAFIENQRFVLRERVVRDNAKKGIGEGLEIELSGLHGRLELQVSERFEKSRERIDVALAGCLDGCRDIVETRFKDDMPRISLTDLPYDNFISTLTLSRKSLQIDLITETSWAFWKKKSVDVEKTIDALKTIAAAELRPALEKLLTAFNEAQSERASAGSDRIRVLVRMMEGSLSERSKRLKKDKRIMEELISDPEHQSRVVNRLQSQIEVLERRLQNLAVADSNLSDAIIAEAA